MPIEGPRVYGTPATFFLLLDGLRRFRSLPYLRYIDTNVMRILGRLIMATKLRLEWEALSDRPLGPDGEPFCPVVLPEKTVKRRRAKYDDEGYEDICANE